MLLDERRPLSSLTDDELNVLGDMLDAWLDKDRHGELASVHGYGIGQNEALSTLYTEHLAETARRKRYPRD
ncbi:hypothetical protein OH828_14550 [Streptomyces anulatus]|uniref:hypothetical protein n=1 Tax=Streptomyces anulatus TaxID=1892 RepID=UPI003870C981